jgi:hypothetical protein
VKALPSHHVLNLFGATLFIAPIVSVLAAEKTDAPTAQTAPAAKPEASTSPSPEKKTSLPGAAGWRSVLNR